MNFLNPEMTSLLNTMANTTPQSADSSWFLSQERFLTSSELKRLLRLTEQRKTEAMYDGKKTAVKEWFLITVATETGLRVQEIADLNCGDIHADGQWRMLSVRNGKGNKPRPVIVRKEFIAACHEFFAWKRKQGESTEREAPIFVTMGRRMTKRALQKAYERTLVRAGISQPQGVGIHSLRHTYASFLLVASGFNLRLVQKQLGHASVRTTQA